MTYVPRSPDGLREVLSQVHAAPSYAAWASRASLPGKTRRSGRFFRHSLNITRAPCRARVQAVPDGGSPPVGDGLVQPERSVLGPNAPSIAEVGPVAEHARRGFGVQGVEHLLEVAAGARVAEVDGLLESSCASASGRSPTSNSPKILSCRSLAPASAARPGRLRFWACPVCGRIR